MLDLLPKVEVASKYGHVTTHAWFEEYSNGGTAIQLYCDMGDGAEPYTDATKWIPGLADGEVAVKDHAENHGVLQGLIEAKIVAKPHRTHALPYGSDSLQICKLLASPVNPDIEG